MLGKPKVGNGTARHGYGLEPLRLCQYRCAYCRLDMATFDGWLQLSIDHVVPQHAIGVGFPSEWVLDLANVVACCRACNDLFNRDPAMDSLPATLDAFFDLRDRSFLLRRERIIERRASERAWFEANVVKTDPRT